MTSPAPDFRPPWAVIMWCDDTHIYTEIPTQSDLPYIRKEPLTEMGLTKSLRFMHSLYIQAKPKGGTRVAEKAKAAAAKPHPLTKGKAQVNTAQADAARAVLRKMGIIK